MWQPTSLGKTHGRGPSFARAGLGEGLFEVMTSQGSIVVVRQCLLTHAVQSAVQRSCGHWASVYFAYGTYSS